MDRKRRNHRPKHVRHARRHGYPHPRDDRRQMAANAGKPDQPRRMEHLGQNKENNLHPVKTITYGLSVKIGAYVVVCVYDVINDKSEHF
jgi:hypothetical protein